MNWLAHLFLARDEPGHRAGNLLGDFMQGVDPMEVPEACREGVEMHRAVDRFTDGHPVVRWAAARLVAHDPQLGRVSGALLDVWFDHILAKNWETWQRADTDLRAFTQCCYLDLMGLRSQLPGRLPSVLPHMAEGDWLASYREPANILRALEGMARRRKRPLPLVDGFRALQRLEAPLAEDFAEFWPELVRRFAPHLEGEH